LPVCARERHPTASNGSSTAKRCGRPGAHHSDWGLLLARTDLDAPKHKGITAFLLDMHTPGIDVRPLRQINGMAHFNEVFFTDVAVPDACRLGPVNERLARRQHDALQRARHDRRGRACRLA
jgi:alkylation response protein AidB-like acyl-CoA dehydrogenase